MKEITEQEALSKAAAYCSSAEHCTAEVVAKLDAWGIPAEGQAPATDGGLFHAAQKQMPVQLWHAAPQNKKGRRWFAAVLNRFISILTIYLNSRG